MNNMEEALYRSGAHIVFKQPQPVAEKELPTNRIKIPIPIWRKKQLSIKRDQRVIGGIARDPVDRKAAIVTSKAPIDCQIQQY